MAEPARQLGPYDSEEPDNTPSPGEVIRPRLASSGQRSGPTHIGNLSAVPEQKENQATPSRGHLRALENGGQNDGAPAGPPAPVPESSSANPSSEPPARPAPGPAHAAKEDSGASGPEGRLAAAPEPVYDVQSPTAQSDPRAGLKVAKSKDRSEEPETEQSDGTNTDTPSKEDLSDAEENADAPKHENQVGRGWRPGEKQYSRFSMSGRLTRRRAALGGGVVSMIIVGLMLLTNLQGPFGFLHFAQLLEKFHFSTAQNEQDNRFMKMSRLYRYASKGEIEKARLSFLGNKFANRFEAKLNASGLSSAYTDKFGLFDGYVIDRNAERFKGMTDDQIKAYVKDTFGVDAVEGSTIKGHGSAINKELVIKASDLGYAKTFKLNYQVLREAGYNKLSAAIGARLFCLKAACIWHPLKKLNVPNASDLKRAIENWTKQNDEEISKGQNAVKGSDPKPADPNSKDPAVQEQAQADTKITETSTEASQVKSGTKSITDFQGGLTSSLAVKTAGAIGLLCMIKGVNDNANQIKQAQVILPLIRLAIEVMAVGGQIESGQGVDLNELHQLYSHMVGLNSNGVTTSYDQAYSIRHNLGQQGGYAPSSTLTSINKGGPFDSILNNVPGLNLVCKTPVLIGSAVLSIAIDATGIGGAINSIVQNGVLAAVSGPLGHQLAQWLAGKAVDVAGLFGDELGSAADFGAALAANGQNIMAGGQALSNNQSGTLSALNNEWNQQEFDQQSIAYRLFNPNDANSAVSKLIDNSSPSFTQNLAKMGSFFTDFGHMFASIPNLFTPMAHAAATPYDYGFPTYGFSEQDMNNPAVQNPYENTCYVIGCASENVPNGQSKPIAGFLTDSNGKVTSTGQKYIDKAKACFGVDIKQIPVQTDNGPEQQWDVVPDSGSLPNPYGNSGYSDNCPSSSGSTATVSLADSSGAGSITAENWLRLRFFIMDTEVMNSMSCYAGDDQACSDIGFGGSTSTSTTVQSGSGAGSTNGSSISINNSVAQQIAQQAGSGVKVGYALYDSSGNLLGGYDENSENYGASITKAMLLVAYLKQAGSGAISPTASGYLTNMIENSDNASGTWVYNHLNNPAADVKAVASEAGMTGFKLDTSDPNYVLGQSQITAGDFAKLFSKIDQLIPSQQRSYGLKLLSNLASSDQTGLLQSGLPGTVYSKEGWKPEPDSTNPFGKEGSPYIVNQAAQFSSGGQTYGLAITVGGVANRTAGEALIQKLVSALIGAQ